MKDPDDAFLDDQFVMGADAINCPHCGAPVAYNAFFDEELECPHCGTKFECEG